jgi:hypothetical protein
LGEFFAIEADDRCGCSTTVRQIQPSSSATGARFSEPDDKLQRTIQYFAPLELPRNALEYRMPAFAGHDG